jgi:hypothetical protein
MKNGVTGTYGQPAMDHPGAPGSGAARPTRSSSRVSDHPARSATAAAQSSFPGMA